MVILTQLGVLENRVEVELLECDPVDGGLQGRDVRLRGVDYGGRGRRDGVLATERPGGDDALAGPEEGKRAAGLDRRVGVFANVVRTGAFSAYSAHGGREGGHVEPGPLLQRRGVVVGREVVARTEDARLVLARMPGGEVAVSGLLGRPRLRREVRGGAGVLGGKKAPSELQGCPMI